MRQAGLGRAPRVATLLCWVTLLAGCGLDDTALPGQSTQPQGDDPSASVAPPTPTAAAPKKPAATRSPRSPHSSPTEAQQPAPTVVLASTVDGLNVDALTRLGSRTLPNFAALVERGATTMNARTEFELTTTLPNHSGVFTGRPVSTTRGGHGVTINDEVTGTVHDYAGEYVASVFDVVHDHGLPTALVATKSKFSLFDRSWSRGAPDRTGADDGTDKLDRFVVAKNDDAAVAEAVALVQRERSGLVFVHVSTPDKVGHSRGFMSGAYLEGMGRVDRNLGRLMSAVDALRSDGVRAVLLLTADHGGAQGAHGHSMVAKPSNYRVPFFAYGSGVPEGGDLYDLNPQYADPGAGRPGYEGRQPIRNGDLANAVLHVLGLRAVPRSRFGEAGPLRVSTR